MQISINLRNHSKTDPHQNKYWDSIFLFVFLKAKMWTTQEAGHVDFFEEHSRHRVLANEKPLGEFMKEGGRNRRYSWVIKKREVEVIILPPKDHDV